MFFRFVRARGRSERNPEPRSGRAACSCILRPSGEGRRLRAQQRIVRRRVVREHRGGGATGRGPACSGAGQCSDLAVRARGQRGWSPRGVSRLSALGLQRSFPGAARVMVPERRKRRDSASVGARVLGVRRPGYKGSGELAVGWESGHNRRRRPSEELREQPRWAEPSLAGTGSWAVGSRARAGWAELQAVGSLPGRSRLPSRGVVVRCSVGCGPVAPPLFVPGTAVRR